MTQSYRIFPERKRVPDTVPPLGTALVPIATTLPAHSTQMLDLDDLVGDLPEAENQAGGLRLQYSGKRGAIKATGGLLHEAEGYSTNIPFSSHDLESTSAPAPITYASVGVMIGKPQPMMGFPPALSFAPYAVLRNATPQPLAVTATFNYAPGGSPVSLSLPVPALQPLETRRLDLGSMLGKLGLANFNGDANLIFSFTGHAGDLVIATGSVDQTANYVFPVLPEGVGKSFGKSHGYWSVANGLDSMYTLWNPAASAQDFVMTLYYGDGSGQYVMPIHLAPQASTTIDIGMLIAMRQPDQDGNLIPAYVQEGGVVFSNPKGKAEWMSLVVSGAFYNPRKGTCGVTCIVCYGYSGASVVASPFYVAVQNRVQLQAQAYGTDGTATDFTSSSSWSSNNEPVATVGGSTGLVSGVSAGPAVIQAQFPYLVQCACDICYDTPNPTCPIYQPNPGSSGTAFTISITSVSVTSAQVNVTLSGPSGTTGFLTLSWQGPSGNNPIVQNASVSTGSYTYSFTPGSLAVGQYTGVTGQWTVDTALASTSYPIMFNVLGTYAQSQYNTPAESQCSGGTGPAFVTPGPNACVWTSVSMIAQFISQAWENGSGISASYGPLQIEWICTPPSGSNYNYFREVSSIVPGCGASHSLSSSTVAWNNTANSNLACGDQVLIVGLGSGVGTVKQVTDYCANTALGCTVTQLDNYNPGAACSANAFPSLPSSPTIRINR